MKTAYEFGRAFGEHMRGERDCDGPVDIEATVTRTVDIPPDDYTAMVRAGIANPDAREYWAGYNSVFGD